MKCHYCATEITKETDPRGVINVREKIEDGINRERYGNVTMCTPCWDRHRPTVVPIRIKWSFYDET